MLPVGMNGPSRAHRRLNLVEVTSRNEIETGNVFSIWLLVAQKCFHLAVETELLLLNFPERGGGSMKNCITFYCPLVLDKLQV
jgi:hypothetical protein